jgi:DNA gyrase subunit A
VVRVSDGDEIMLITNSGILVRTRVDEISVVGRNTQGVTVIRLGKNEKVVGVDRIEGLPDDDENAEQEQTDSNTDSNTDTDSLTNGENE